MLIIVSPSKTLDFSRQKKATEFSIPEFLGEAEILINELKKYSGRDLADLMGISYKLSEMNYERYLSWNIDHNVDNSKQALLAFKGEVYNGLRPENFNAEDFDFAQIHLRLLSGLYGVIRPNDLIQEYRLEMGTKLENPVGKNLYDYWGEKISNSLNRILDTMDQRILINLASNEYYKSFDSKNINARIITPSFKEEKGDEYKMITVYAKKARGLMARFIIKNRITNPEEMKAFDLEGYFFSQEMSTENDWVFTR